MPWGGTGGNAKEPPPCEQSGRLTELLNPRSNSHLSRKEAKRCGVEEPIFANAPVQSFLASLLAHSSSGRACSLRCVDTVLRAMVLDTTGSRDIGRLRQRLLNGAPWLMISFLIFNHGLFGVPHSCLSPVHRVSSAMPPSEVPLAVIHHPQCLHLRPPWLDPSSCSYRAHHARWRLPPRLDQGPSLLRYTWSISIEV